MAIELSIPRPEVKRRITVMEILNGPYIDPIKRLGLLSPADYEGVVHEWATDYLEGKYQRVRIFAGAGDKGRDVVGYYEDGAVDIYQCKHYNSKVAPTILYPELGKLCYYTFLKSYPIPNNYFIVAPKGCGPEVLGMIDKPKDINATLISNWERHCQNEITKKIEVKLEGDFLKYVQEFDFSILADIDPNEFVKQHAQTRFHITSFGNGVKKYRDIIPEPDVSIHSREQKYTSSLFEVYGVECGRTIQNLEELQAEDKLLKHFVQQRKSFYSAESLDKFSRENFPDANPMPFEELKDDAETILLTTLELNNTESGYRKVLLASQEIKRHDFANSPLSVEIKPLDKDGLCHHLVNDDRIKWTE